MKLRELEPKWLRYNEAPSGLYFTEVDDIQRAQGLQFLCPKCFAVNGGAEGTHAIICWKPEVPQTIHPTPGRWDFVGSGFDDLSLVAGSSSILLTSGCLWHGWITRGEATENPPS